MKRYFLDIYESIISIIGGMGITLVHLFRARNDNVTLQYPEEKWPRPERNIGFDHSNYNVIRSSNFKIIKPMSYPCIAA